MDKERENRFHTLLESLIYEATDPEGLDPKPINEILAELCKMFRICKGVTCFYQSLNHERMGKGDVMVCYDTGEECESAMSIRIMTKVMAVVTCTVYMTPGTEPLSDEECERVDLVMRTVLSFVSRNRLQGAIEVLGFRDEKGFRNTRDFMRGLAMLNEQGRLAGMAALNFNLLHFSLVNEEIGRAEGDIVMRNYIATLERIIGDKGMICRLGGDNFVGTCTEDLLEEVLAYLKETPVVYDLDEGKRVMVQSSVGVYMIPDDFRLRDPGQIMDKIICALTAARHGGKEHIVFYHDNLLDGREKKMRVQQRFPEALRSEEFKVFYQPKIDVNTGELVGAEALCRWFRKGKIIPPMEFIPILEENTDICKLDFYMLEHVCRDIRRWLEMGKKAVRISVNLSRKHMMDIDLLKNIIELIDRYGVPHHLIEIELTETTTDVEFRDLKRVVGGLQQAGVRTSVDDFGMGYSSLNLIREIPWNVLKVDRSFLPIEGEEEGTAQVMFKHVVAMARELGLECIAEGVETPEQVTVLRDNHCDIAQGFFYDKPLPVDQFEERMDGHHYPAVGELRSETGGNT